MSSRRTIHISTASEDIIGEAENISGRINSIIVRYGNIVASECPTLALTEWQMICDMLNAPVINADHRDSDPACFLWSDIAESGRLDGLAEKWGVDTDDLSQRIRLMTYPQQVAIIDVVARFWLSPKRNVLPMDELLRECGAKMPV